MPQAQLGDRVQVQYFRIPDEGVITDQLPTHMTCEFSVGSREVFHTLSFGVVGMTLGCRKRLTLQPHEAFGRIRRGRFRQIPLSHLPPDTVLEVGKRINLVRRIDGKRRHGTIVEIKLDSVLVDGNHRLAGKVIELEVLLVSLVSSLLNARQDQSQFDIGGES